MVGLVALIVGGSVLAYVALALHRPLLAGGVFVAAVLLAMAEGAYRLHSRAVARHDVAERQLEEYAERKPELSFGEAVLPKASQAIHLPGGQPGQPGWTARGRVIRVPVTNAFGAGEARQVHARLRFDRTPGGSTYLPDPTQAEWFGENGPEVEIDMPGNGRPREIDIAVVLEGQADGSYEWTTKSRAAGLQGYEIRSWPFEVEIEVMGSGGASVGAHLKRTIEIDVQRGLIRARWLDADPNGPTNWVARGI